MTRPEATTAAILDAMTRPEAMTAAILDAIRQMKEEHPEPWQVWRDITAQLREPVPKVELTVDVSRLGEDLALNSDDASLYGTSGELDPRGYWVPDVG